MIHYHNNRYLEPILTLIKQGNTTSKKQFPKLRARQKRTDDKQVIAASMSKSENNCPLNLHRIRKKNSMIHPHDESLLLLVDFKANPNVSARLLDAELEPLKPHLSKVKNGFFYKGRVTVVVSGNRPKKGNLVSRKAHSTMSGGGIPQPSRVNTVKERYLFIDGRMRDLRRQEDTLLFPLISLDWKVVQLQRLAGRGEKFMTKVSSQAHKQGKRVRIWGAPNKEHFWNSMVNSNIDWLSIDDHSRFSMFVSRLKKVRPFS